MLLHALLLAFFLLAPPLGMGGTHGTLLLVPIEVVSAVESEAVPQPILDDARKGAETEVSALAHAATGGGSAGATARPTDDLLTKLQSLAALRQPDRAHPKAAQSASMASATAASDNAAAGHLATLKDAIRVQVERHWSFNRASLGGGDVSVPIEVEINSRGEVLKAELLDTARNADPAYRDVALSARNAALLASPLTLPAGNYDSVMHLVLYLNPRAALQ